MWYVPPWIRQALSQLPMGRIVGVPDEQGYLDNVRFPGRAAELGWVAVAPARSARQNGASLDHSHNVLVVEETLIVISFRRVEYRLIMRRWGCGEVGRFVGLRLSHGIRLREHFPNPIYLPAQSSQAGYFSQPQLR